MNYYWIRFWVLEFPACPMYERLVKAKTFSLACQKIVKIIPGSYDFENLTIL